MSLYYDIMTGEVRKCTLYPDRLDLNVTDNWYPLYNYKGEYAGAVIDGEYMTVNEIREKWRKYNR